MYLYECVCDYVEWETDHVLAADNLILHPLSNGPAKAVLHHSLGVGAVYFRVTARNGC